ncbi:MAG: ROK family glucokinase [Planctomycetaceae bacterium]|nr:ROK family glucokinase [Planctomycetaceae bacterium]
MELFIGFDIGGTNLKLGLFDEKLKLLDKDNVANPAGLTAEWLVEHAFQSANTMLTRNGYKLSDLKAAGVGCPGTIDMKNGIIIASPNLPFKQTPLRQMLSTKLGCPCIVENDANAAAWGEYAAGAAKDINDMVFLTLGTGIGGGIISDGMMVRGHSGQAGELGHMIVYPKGRRRCNCGQYGCAEVYASASHTANRANDRLKQGVPQTTLNDVYREKGQVTSKDVFDHAKKGDPFATEIVDGTAEALGLLCINITHFTEPQCVILAGGMIAAGDYLLKKIKEQFKKYVWTMQEQTLDVRFATLGEDAGIYGAGDLAIRQKEQS